MDWTAIAVFVAFIAYTWHRERRDERLWQDRQRESDRVAKERQADCHEFHRQLNIETGKFFEGAAKALNRYSDTVAEQVDRHKVVNDLHIAMVQIEDLKAQIRDLKGPTPSVQT